jgi:hypothetical protein
LQGVIPVTHIPAALTLQQLTGVWVEQYAPAPDEPTPPSGGGGSGINHAQNYSHYNQAPDTRETPRVDYLRQARREDEDLLILMKTFVEIIKCH